MKDDNPQRRTSEPKETHVLKIRLARCQAEEGVDRHERITEKKGGTRKRTWAGSHEEADRFDASVRRHCEGTITTTTTTKTSTISNFVQCRGRLQL